MNLRVVAAFAAVVASAAFTAWGAAPAASAPAAAASAPATLPGRGGRGRGGRGGGGQGGPAITVSPPADAVDAPTTDKNGNFKIASPFTNAPELTAKPDVPQGTVVRFVIDSADSDMYPGISRTAPGTVPFRRNVSVYVPAGYKEGTAVPFLFCNDAQNQRDIPIILNNMIAAKRVPAMAAIFAGNGGGDAQGSERGLEYDTVSGKFAEYVEKIILPRVEKEAKVTLSKDPDDRCTLGGSSGAAAAFTMAWFHPDLYHRVISYSGTFVNQQSPANPETPHGAWEYHENLIPKSEKKPLRVWLEVGSNDLQATSAEAGFHNWPLANIHMADVLKAKGYDYQFVWATGAGHVDGGAVRQTLPEALEWVWKPAKVK